MSKLYSALQTVRISPTASLSVLGTISTDFEALYIKSDGFVYHTKSDLFERRLAHDLLLGNGLTYSSIMQNSIAPYGSILSLNIGSGLTFSNSRLSVSFVTASQISTSNSPSEDKVLGYQSGQLSWVNRLLISDLSTLYGIDCGVDYTPMPTYSISGGVYTLGIYCEYTGTTTTTTTTCPSFTALGLTFSDAAPDTLIQNNGIYDFQVYDGSNLVPAANLNSGDSYLCEVGNFGTGIIRITLAGCGDYCFNFNPGYDYLPGCVLP